MVPGLCRGSQAGPREYSIMKASAKILDRHMLAAGEV